MNSTVIGLMVLFSSGGLYALTLNARYIHMLTRLRHLYDTHIDSTEISYVITQTLLLKYSFFSIVVSAIFSILYVLSTLLGLLPSILTILLTIDLVLIIISMILFASEILVSRNSIMVHLQNDYRKD